MFSHCRDFQQRVLVARPLPMVILILITPGFILGQVRLDLRPRLNKGDVHRFSVTLDQTIEQAAPAQGAVGAVPLTGRRTHQTITTTYTFKVEDINSKGATLSLGYDSVAFHAKTPAGDVDYDSAIPPGQIPPAISAMAALVGHGYSIQIDSRGEVIRTIGADKLLADILAKLSIPQGAARMAFEKSLGRQLDEKDLKANLQTMFAPWADYPVSLGDIWIRKSRPGVDFPMTVESAYTLEKSEDEVCTVSLEGKLATIPAATIDMKPMSLGYDLAGRQHGQVRISTRTGWINSAEISQKLTGSATLRSPSTLPETVHMTIEMTMKVEQK